jgi:hypothetical protein
MDRKPAAINIIFDGPPQGPKVADLLRLKPMTGKASALVNGFNDRTGTGG